MTCSAHPTLICLLQQIASAVQPQIDPWGDFWKGLMPVFAGAIFAFATSWLIALLQQKRQKTNDYIQRLDDALVVYMHALGDRLAESDKWLAIDAQAVAEATRRPLALLPPRELETRADAVWMVSRGDDVAIAKELKLAVTRIGAGSAENDKALALRNTGQIVRAWRNGTNSRETAAGRLRGLSV
ncbi:hypothetical protein ITJ38_03385 [Agreia pratensis]|uniref:hypothetical protein n=1 Tax=Agreia pratensis TaxID=150121 RepID=UPI00188DB982|nr:hypothetical protein [Agreia pratensis]MBF4633441.1 hypothetical protein [Agreia pratensis]